MKQNGHRRSPELPGVLVLSLDFELFWGVRDKRTIAEYGPRLLGARQAVPVLLDLFDAYGVRATWATVGLLFFSRREDLLRSLPVVRPAYARPALSAYAGLDELGPDETADPFHYAGTLVDAILRHPSQELGSHTFAHYYCQEPGHSPESFAADLQAAVAAGLARGVALRSLVFPRNQVNPAYRGLCAEHGFTAWRGCGAGPAGVHRAGPCIRALRLLDAYCNLSGHGDYAREAIAGPAPRNIRASAFLRPYSPRLAPLEPLKLRRIRRAMTHAARHGRVFHLWWHPHNFGCHLERNVADLRSLLDHFRTLSRRYGMISQSMGELAGD